MHGNFITSLVYYVSINPWAFWDAPLQFEKVSINSTCTRLALKPAEMCSVQPLFRIVVKIWWVGGCYCGISIMFPGNNMYTATAWLCG